MYNRNKKFESLLKKRKANEINEEREFNSLCYAERYAFLTEKLILEKEHETFSKDWLKNWKPKKKSNHAEETSKDIAPVPLSLNEDDNLINLDLNSHSNTDLSINKQIIKNSSYRFYIFNPNSKEAPKDPVMSSTVTIKKI